jgi:chemotaxis protein MotB
VITPYGLRVMLHDTDRQGMFVRGSAVPTDRFRKLLRKMGPLFAQMENQMLIVGHTDSLQYADTGYAASPTGPCRPTAPCRRARSC